jgi:hypothetical protein
VLWQRVRAHGVRPKCNGLALYAGGDFDRSGEEGRAESRADPATWTSLASGVEGGRPAAVLTLVDVERRARVGGEFETAGGRSRRTRALGRTRVRVRTGTNGDGALLALQGKAGLGGDFTVIDLTRGELAARTQ